MLMGAQKAYEEGSILMDAPEHDTMAELAELARTENLLIMACWWYK